VRYRHLAMWIAVIGILGAGPHPARAGRLPRYSGTLRIQLPTVPKALDPLRVAGDADALVAACVFEGLTTWGAERAAPGLARRWLSGDDDKRWVFYLRPDALFHDGTPCDAEAVSASLHRLADPHLSNHAWILQALVGWDDYAQGKTPHLEGVYVVSPTEMELLFSRPVPDLAERLALPAAAIVRAQGDVCSGTGPFRVAEITATAVQLAAFDRHYAGRPFLDQLEFRAGLDSVAAGRLRRVDPAATAAGSRTIRVPAWRLAVALVHPKSAALSTRSARRRLQAFDCSEFVREALSGDGEPAEGLVPGGAVPPPAAAEAESGAAAPARQRVRIVVAEQEPVLQKIGARLRAELVASGQDAELDALPAGEFATAVQAGSCDIVLLGWTPPQPAGEMSEAARVRYALSALLQPVLGEPAPAEAGKGDRLPAAWRPLVSGHDAPTEAALLATGHLVPLLFFHDTWEAPAALANVHAATLAADLGLASAHFEPKSP
jgi:peptide/nickel transport system substrate-binding protein